MVRQGEVTTLEKLYPAPYLRPSRSSCIHLLLLTILGLLKIARLSFLSIDSCVYRFMWIAQKMVKYIHNGWDTSKVKQTPTMLPSQQRMASKNANTDKNAISITAMFATNAIDIAAPAARASMKFFSFLRKEDKWKYQQQQPTSLLFYTMCLQYLLWVESSILLVL